MSGEGFVLSLIRNGQIDEALELVTPEMAAHGLTRELVHNKDWISLFLCQVFEHEKAILVIDNLVTKGYTKRAAVFPFYEFHLPYLQQKTFLHLFLNVTGLYTNTECFIHMIDLMPRKELDPFFDAKTIVTLEDTINQYAVNGEFFYAVYHRYLASREKARIASIALIGAARVAGRCAAKDVMRVISRVVWSTRMSERWDE